MAPLKKICALLLCALLVAGQPTAGMTAAASVTEPQVKAVFVFNFSHFVEWPADAFATPTAPFVIGVLSGEALATQLEVAIRGEHVAQHPLQVRRLSDIADVGDCHILYIDKSAGAQLASILAALNGRRTLTVSDLDGASQRGVMIQLATESNRIRLMINVESARDAGLTISSNLLRPAQIVRTSGGP
ncbi:MAG TPA: YfiR family protein [Steroidobacteraceae bacterium]|nr:YfiR family protein [Steroidobacteraceae bacterium]